MDTANRDVATSNFIYDVLTLGGTYKASIHTLLYDVTPLPLNQTMKSLAINLF